VIDRIKSRAILPALLIILSGLSVQGCVGAVVAGGATAGVAASQERGVKGAASDTGIRAEINHYWVQKDQSLFANCNLQIHEGRVLVTGAVKDAETRAEAIQLAWKASGVKEVINEIEVTSEGGIGAYARDTTILTELRSRLLFTKDIQSVNYSIEAVNGTVYLLGVAQSQAELDKAIEIARNVRYVRRVVSHVLMKDDPRRFRAPAA
jgi:osmotically-inducible protein OsmY